MCRKRLENVEEVKLARITLAEDENKHKKKMQFLHTVHCVIFNNFYNQRCNWYLFCLLSLLLKKMLLVLSSVPIVKQQFNNINGKHHRNKH